MTATGNHTGNYKVLIVDDSKFFGTALSKIVSTKFAVVGAALSGQEALEKIAALSPDIVLLDVTMPNMDGRECLEKIMGLNRGTIVLMVSGIQSAEVKEECLRLGAEAFIVKDQINLTNTKPDNFLLKSIEAVLQARNARKTG